MPRRGLELALQLHRTPDKHLSSLTGPVVALAFKLEEGKFGQLTYMRLYSGTLRKGEFLVNTASGKRIKVMTAGWLASHAPISPPHMTHSNALVSGLLCCI